MQSEPSLEYSLDSSTQHACVSTNATAGHDAIVSVTGSSVPVDADNTAVAKVVGTKPGHGYGNHVGMSVPIGVMSSSDLNIGITNSNHNIHKITSSKVDMSVPASARKVRLGTPGTGKERQDKILADKPRMIERVVLKEVPKKKIVVQEKKEIEEMSVSFFSNLFQGHHTTNGELGEEPFCPDFTDLDYFLEGLGELTESQQEMLVEEIDLEEVKEVIKELETNKSPGVDGLTTEFYKHHIDVLSPVLQEVYNEILSMLQMVESNKMGATRLVSKLAGLLVPLVSQLRPITLLNVDYKILSKILTKRIMKVLSSVIRSSQSCSVEGVTITGAAFNLISLVEGVARCGGEAAILSFDMFKAYDRVDLRYLEKVLKAMKFPDVFIDWILLLHEDVQTMLLLDFITKPIDITFSVRQGDPIAMVLFILYMEPLLLRLSEATAGYGLKAPCGTYDAVPTVGVIEKLEAYVDDVEVVVTEEEEFIAVDRVFRRWEVVSGAILSYIAL